MRVEVIAIKEAGKPADHKVWDHMTQREVNKVISFISLSLNSTNNAERFERVRFVVTDAVSRLSEVEEEAGPDSMLRKG